MAGYEIIMTMPDYISKIEESEKEKQELIEYLKESTDIVKSNKRLFYAILLNILIIILFIIIWLTLNENMTIIIIVFITSIISFSYLFYQIIKKL